MFCKTWGNSLFEVLNKIQNFTDKNYILRSNN